MWFDNGGPNFKFTDAVSFVVNCDTQEEIDHYCEALVSGGGTQIECGSLKDKYGLAWQIVPPIFRDPIQDATARTPNVMHALTQMRKLDIPHPEAFSSKRRIRMGLARTHFAYNATVSIAIETCRRILSEMESNSDSIGLW